MSSLKNVGFALHSICEAMNWNRIGLVFTTESSIMRSVGTSPLIIGREVVFISYIASLDGLVDMSLTVQRIVEENLRIIVFLGEPNGLLSLLLGLDAIGELEGRQIVSDPISTSEVVPLLSAHFGKPYLPKSVFGLAPTTDFSLSSVYRQLETNITAYSTARNHSYLNVLPYTIVPFTPFEQYAMEAIEAAALALHNLLEEEEDIQTTNATMLIPRIRNNTFQTTFGNLAFAPEGELRIQSYAISSFNVDYLNFFPVGEWNDHTGLSYDESKLYFTQGELPDVIPDAFPPRPIEFIAFENVTSQSVDVLWNIPNLRSGKNYSAEVLVSRDSRFALGTLPVMSMVVSSSTASLSGLRPDSTYYIFVNISTHAGYTVSRTITVETTSQNASYEINSALFNTMAVLSSILILVTVVMQVFMHRVRKHPVMKASSVTLLHILSTGAILAFSSMYFGGHHSTKCSVPVWTLSVAFMAIFGTLFARSWRLYRIFCEHHIMRIPKIPNRHLLGIVSAFIVFECLFLLLWFLLAPPTPTRTLISGSSTDFEWTCTSDHPQIWWALSLVPKFALLAGGCYMSYRIRDIDPRFNESSIAAFSMWNTVLMMGIVICLYVLIERENVKYLILSIGTIVVTGSTVFALIFSKFMVVQNAIHTEKTRALKTSHMSDLTLRTGAANSQFTGALPTSGAAASNSPIRAIMAHAGQRTHQLPQHIARKSQESRMSLGSNLPSLFGRPQLGSRFSAAEAHGGEPESPRSSIGEKKVVQRPLVQRSASSHQSPR